MLQRYNRADYVLAGVAIAFVLALCLQYRYHGILWADGLLAVVEAALVGGIADWFAVTALFRKPLGITQHTALIPRNRQRIIAAAATMVQHEFFAKERLRTVLQQISFAAFVVRWGERESVRRALSRFIAHYIKHWAAHVDWEAAVIRLATYSRGQLVQQSALPWVLTGAKWLLQPQREQAMLSTLCLYLAREAQRPELHRFIYQLLEVYKRQKTSGFLGAIMGFIGEATDIINLDDAAVAVQQQLVKLLTDMVEFNHPLRNSLRQQAAALCEQLETNEKWQQQLEAWKVSAVDHLDLTEYLLQFVKTLKRASFAASEGENGEAQSPLEQWLAKAIADYWHSFADNELLQSWLEDYLQELVWRIIDREHDLIGRIVAEAMQVLSDAELNRLIEAKAGEDLVWIRINGSVVGAVIGLVLFIGGQFWV